MLQTQTPEAGACYLIGAGMKKIESTGLKLGQVVSYGDMANARQNAVVIETEGGPSGQRCIFVESLSETDVSITSIESPGGWEMENEIWTPATVDELKVKLGEAQQQRHEAAVRASAKAKALMAEGKARYEEMKPGWAQAAIIAVHQVDDCDIMTDYFNVKHTRSVFLCWSKHHRDLFSEFRKAAALFGPTADLATAGKEVERREKHSGGRGYVLGAPPYNTGWIIKKLELAHRIFVEDLYKIMGDPSNIAQPAEKEEAPTFVAKGEDITITENEKLNGIEIQFAEKPARSLLNSLPAHGFRWHRKKRLWYAKRTPERLAFCQSLTSEEA